MPAVAATTAAAAAAGVAATLVMAMPAAATAAAAAAATASSVVSCGFSYQSFKKTRDVVHSGFGLFFGLAGEVVRLRGGFSSVRHPPAAVAVATATIRSFTRPSHYIYSQYSFYF